ncbi:hypothetical protein [Spiroplasma endosymbiont of Lariophagus distinguendus]|nr:hypothetical protein [Spiroplasma endosymbiont of Lariophagus distinguendus]
MGIPLNWCCKRIGATWKPFLRIPYKTKTHAKQESQFIVEGI